MSKKILLPTHPLFKNLIGKKYGRLEVMYYAGRKSPGKHQWLCNCSCGASVTVISSSLQEGNTQSCGCLRSEISRRFLSKHGLAYSPEYQIWENIKSRCLNPNNAAFKDYGGRGIKVCKRWLKFENFYKDMGPKPSPKHEIDRKNNNKGYYPGNCRWSTRSQQTRNTRRNVMITYKNKTLCLTDWAILLNVKRSTLNNRLEKGWSVEKALSAPVRAKK